MTDKNPVEYGYKGDEQVTISGREFLLVRQAIEDAINNATTHRFDEVIKYVNVETGEDYTPQENDDLKLLTALNKVRPVTDIRATVNSDNLTISFDPNKLTKEILQANELLLSIHLRNIENNVCVHKDSL